MFSDGFLMSADFYRVQDKNIFSGHKTRTLLYLDFWYNAWFIRYTFLLQYLSNISETPYNITFCSLACVTYFNKREKNEIDGNLIWESEFRSHYVGRLKFFRPFRVYDAHDMCGMTLKILGWERPSTHGERQRPVSECYWCVLVKRTYHGAITISLMSPIFLSLSPSASLSFPSPFLTTHLISSLTFLPPSISLSYPLTKFHYI